MLLIRRIDKGIDIGLRVLTHCGLSVSTHFGIENQKLKMTNILEKGLNSILYQTVQKSKLLTT